MTDLATTATADGGSPPGPALFLIFSPFLIFAVMMYAAPAAWALLTTAAVALILTAVDIWRGRTIKVLSAGTAVLFGGLGLDLLLSPEHWSNVAVRLFVDSGLLALTLVSIIVKRPFTLQYAREQVDAATAQLPGFLHANYILTWAWVAAFALMLIADILMIYIPSLPLWLGAAIAFAARSAAKQFTRWYPKHRVSTASAGNSVLST